MENEKNNFDVLLLLGFSGETALYTFIHNYNQTKKLIEKWIYVSYFALTLRAVVFRNLHANLKLHASTNASSMLETL